MSNELVIKISGEIKDLEKAFDKAKEQTEGLDSSLQKLAKISAIAFAAFTAEAILAVSAFRKQEEASNSLRQAMEQQGIFTDNLFESYKNLAEQIEKKTGIDAESINEGQAVLQSMIGQKAISEELTKAVVDLSARKKIDLFSAFELVGKAANGNVEVFKKMGVEVTNTGSRAGNLVAIQKALNDAFGGAAEVAAQTTGNTARLATAFDDLQKGIGSRLAPAFDVIVSGITAFLNAISENKLLLDFIVGVGVAGGVLAAMGTVAGLAGTAFLTLRAALLAFNVTTAASTIAVKALIGATGIGLLVVLATTVFLNWETIWPKVTSVFKTFADQVSQYASAIGKIVYGALFKFDLGMIREGLDGLKAAYQNTLKSVTESGKTELDKQETDQEKHRNAMLEAEKNQTTAREKEMRRREALETQIETGKRAVILMKINEANAQVIKLQEQENQILAQLNDEKYAKLYGQLNDHLTRVRALKDEALAQQVAQENALNEQVLATNKQFQALTEVDQRAFLDQNGAMLRQQIDTEKQVRDAAILENAQTQIKSQNEYLRNRQKFGESYAIINRAIHSEEVQGARSAASDLTQLQQSSNSTLKAIGKAAAVADIAISTAVSAMNIYRGFSSIPIIGPALGVAGAAAAVAFGAERTSMVLAAAEGGLVTGGIPGRDSVPMIAMPGELVVPTRNYEEVVSAVADRRNADSGSGGTGGGFAHVVLELKDSLAEFVEAKLIERENLGLSYRGAS